MLLGVDDCVRKGLLTVITTEFRIHNKEEGDRQLSVESVTYVFFFFSKRLVGEGSYFNFMQMGESGGGLEGEGGTGKKKKKLLCAGKFINAVFIGRWIT